MNSKGTDASSGSDAPLELPWLLRLLRRLPVPHKLGLLERIYGRQLGRVGTRWVECANGVTWKLDLTDSSQRWCVLGDYEGSLQMNWLRSWLANGGAVVDSGASIGQMIIYLAPIRGVSIHAFEPTRASREWLSECVQRNNFENVQVLPWGLSDDMSRRMILSLGSRSTLRMEGNSRLCTSKEEIDLVRLDDYAANRSIERLRLWKLDVEYHECEALTGAQRMLETRAIDAILIEVSHVTFEMVKERLARARYSLWRLCRGGREPVDSLPALGTYNLLALPNGVMRP